MEITFLKFKSCLISKTSCIRQKTSQIPEKENIGFEGCPLVIFKNSGKFFFSRNWKFFVNSNRKLWSRDPGGG